MKMRCLKIVFLMLLGIFILKPAEAQEIDIFVFQTKTDDMQYSERKNDFNAQLPENFTVLPTIALLKEAPTPEEEERTAKKRLKKLVSDSLEHLMKRNGLEKELRTLKKIESPVDVRLPTDSGVTVHLSGRFDIKWFERGNIAFRSSGEIKEDSYKIWTGMTITF
ncbi:hypothetical protein C4569_02915 [Candidatus Parcubacteria bacterium]|nr:MAG: hypothetical protein C4569_02915 [Candidatus Parcubacteria bacterium]